MYRLIPSDYCSTPSVEGCHTDIDSGRNGEDVAERVMTNIDRTLRRLRTVAQRLDNSLSTDD